MKYWILEQFWRLDCTNHYITEKWFLLLSSSLFQSFSHPHRILTFHKCKTKSLTGEMQFQMCSTWFMLYLCFYWTIFHVSCFLLTKWKSCLWILGVYGDTRLLSEEIIELGRFYDVYHCARNAERSHSNVS